MISLVMPFYNHWELTHARLFELFRYGERLDEIVLVDDHSDEQECLRGVDWWRNEMGRKLAYTLKCVRNEKNLGFLKSSNIGMSRATGDVLILLSNDVRITGNVISQIIGALSEDNRRLIGNRLIDWNSGWNSFNGKIYPYLEGYLLACIKDVWDDLGGFDERFSPMDMEDVDLSTQAIQLGIKLVPLNSPHVNHMGAGTLGYNPKREAITKRNKKKFEKKWNE